MSILMMLLRSLAPRIGTPADPATTYLDEAVDIPDLERRMREVDVRGQ